MEQAFADNAFALAEDTEVDDDDLETIDVWGWPALLSALSRGQFDLAISILNKGASLAAVTPGGKTCYRSLLFLSSLAKVQLVFAQG